jgi:hypothetical protein
LAPCRTLAIWSIVMAAFARTLPPEMLSHRHEYRCALLFPLKVAKGKRFQCYTFHCHELFRVVE